MRQTMTAALAVLLTISSCRGVQEAGGTVPDGSTAPDAAASVTTAAPTAIDATADVTITKCLPGDYGTFNPQLRIFNNTDTAASYTVTVSINDPDGTRLAEADASPIAIAAGQTATLLAFGTLADPPAEVSCAVASATRFGL
jgi:hypothetical protein